MNKLRAMVATLLSITMLLLTVGCFAENNSQTNQVATNNGKFPTFKTTDVNGDSVTNDIFKGKKITVINIWGTFCPPCIAEMPELGVWANEMPKDAQIIGIVCDADGESDKATIKKAVNILNDANAKFINLLPNNEIMQYLNNVSAVPTTIFVDSEGNILGESIVGANVPKYKSRLTEYLK